MKPRYDPAKTPLRSDPGRRRDTPQAVGFGTFGLIWHPISWLAGKLQADRHTPFYQDTDLRQIDGWSAQIVSAATIVIPGDFRIDLGVTEDPVRKASADVVFHFALRKRL